MVYGMNFLFILLIAYGFIGLSEYGFMNNPFILSRAL